MLLGNHRFIGKQLYRIRLTGVGQFSKDVVSLAFHSFTRGAAAHSIHKIGDSNPKIRLLYIHSGWAIYNVGLLWFSQTPGIGCTLVTIEEFLSHPEMQDEYDVLFFGYSHLLELAKDLSLTKRAWTCVHDPVEIYPEVAHWASLDPSPNVIATLKKVDRVFVISCEVQQLLLQAGIESVRIPTASLLPARSLTDLDASRDTHPKVLTVGRVYPRKNYELYKEIGRAANQRFGNVIEFSAKWDYTPLPESEYVRRLDASNVYLCTSYQEGGPLPAMDAMRRGQLVLSTQVGQMPELIQEGVNGFICRTRDDFLDRLGKLVSDSSLLHNMRRNSLLQIQSRRSMEVIVDAVKRAVTIGR
jgi:glycosyltransferase involved in cell wall biosynthesis